MDDPYAAYTEEAACYEVGGADLSEVLPPFTAGLLAATGRLPAVLAWREALAWGDRLFKRRAAKARYTVLALLPPPCDGPDREFRLRVARAFDDLAGDVEAGRAPLPRCTGERHALEIMIDRAPHLLAGTDEELDRLGVPVPDADDEHEYRAPFCEEVWSEFVTTDAEYSIPEAQPNSDGHDDDDEHKREPPQPPPGGWGAPRCWFSPFGITTPRDAGRAHPAWVMRALEGEQAEPEPLGFAPAARLLGFTDRVDPWFATTMTPTPRRSPT